MSKLTSRTQLLAHNRRLKQEKQVAIKKARLEVESMRWEFNAMIWIQDTWLWKAYSYFKKPKYV